jgi:release factor glutamine methyltransferase
VSLAARDLVAWAGARLAPVSDCARLEAELLLGTAAGLDRASIMAHPERRVASSEAAWLLAAVDRRSRGEPLAYILGRREFYSLDLAVDAGVLVPRPETELLVERALASEPAPGARVLDLGTGSGALALALKCARPDFAVLGTDCSPQALAVARRNGTALGLDVTWLQSDWFAALGGQQFDLIVSNPPYVRSDDSHFATALRHEPRLALDGGEDGLDAYRAILGEAAAHLTGNGVVIFEHGFAQREALTELAAACGFTRTDAVADLAGLPRAAVFRVAARD